MRMLNYSASGASSAQLPGWEWEEVLQPTHSGNTLKTWSQSSEAGGAQTSMEKSALPPKRSYGEPQKYKMFTILF